MHRVLITSVAVLLLLTAVSSGLYIDVPDYETGIASAGVNDVINGLYGDVIFATDSGISFYSANGTWSSVNARFPGETAYGRISPLNIMVTAVSLDARGRLWIGYPNGLQIQTDTGYEAIQDLDLLKNLQINCMARWGDETWVATGRAGLHRYHDGNWTWYRPLGPEMLGCYTIVSMAVDAESDALVIGSEYDGVWILLNRSENVCFEPVGYQGEPVPGISEVRVDPFGGVYLFNQTTVLRYTPDAGVSPVLDAGDLSTFPVVINDLVATPDGTLLIASDRGIYGWNSSNVTLHITSKDGIRSNVVKKLFLDANGRCWFVVPGNVGYLPPMTGPSAKLDLKAAPVQTPDVTATTLPLPSDTPVLPETAREKPSRAVDLLEGAWNSLQEWIGAVSARV